MATMGREQIFYRILVLLIILTTITAILNLTSSGAVTLGDMGSSDYMQTLPGQAIPNVAGISSVGNSVSSIASTVYGTQDYTKTSGFEPNVTKVESLFISGPTWTRSDGVGYEWSYGNFAQISLDGSTPSKGIYDNVYHINNQMQNYPIYILLYGAETGANTVSGFYVKYTQNDISIIHSYDPTNEIKSIPANYANTGSTYETVFDANNGIVDVYIDGNFVTEFSNIVYYPPSAGELIAGNTLTLTGVGGASGGSGVYYAGMAASNDLSLSSVDGTFTLPNPPTDVLTALFQLVNELISDAFEIATAVAVMLGLTSNPFVPFWLWAILAIPCLVTLGLIIVETIRGN